MTALLLPIMFVALGRAYDIPENDRAILSRVAMEYHLTGEQRRLLYAIRIVENGGPGRELGVLTPRAMRFQGDHDKSLECQARWAAGTIRKRYNGDLAQFSQAWAPIGAPNDPNGLNNYWLRNARDTLKKL